MFHIIPCFPTLQNYLTLQVCLALVGVYRDIVGRFPHFKHIRFTQHGEEGDRRFCRHLLQDLFSQGNNGIGVVVKLSASSIWLELEF